MEDEMKASVQVLPNLYCWHGKKKDKACEMGWENWESWQHTEAVDSMLQTYHKLFVNVCLVLFFILLSSVNESWETKPTIDWTIQSPPERTREEEEEKALKWLQGS